MDSSKGDLYLKVEIEFPRDNWYVEKNDLTKIRNILPTKLTQEEKRLMFQKQVSSYLLIFRL